MHSPSSIWSIFKLTHYPFLASLDAASGVASLIGVVAFWRWYGTRFREPDEIVKLAIGCAISASAFVIVALAAQQEAATGVTVSLWVALAIHLINGVGFSNVFPVSLALYSRAAPPQFGATMIGVYYLFLFLANLGVGILGGFLNKMPPMAFWGLHAGLILGAATVFVMVKLCFGRVLVRGAD